MFIILIITKMLWQAWDNAEELIAAIVVTIGLIQDTASIFEKIRSFRNVRFGSWLEVVISNTFFDDDRNFSSSYYLVFLPH